MRNIRPPTDDDYFTLALIQNGLTEPHFHVTGGALMRQDEKASQKNVKDFGRLVLEQEGRVVGMETWWKPDFDLPDRFWISLDLHPDHRDSETAQVLLSALIARVLPLGARKLWFSAREDYLPGFPFLPDLGFREVHRTFGGGFFLDGLNPRLLTALESRLSGQGLTLRAYADLVSDPLRDAKLHALYEAFAPDKFTAPPTIPAAGGSFLDADSILEAAFVAERGGEYVGLAVPERAGPGAWNAVLGVRRDVRGQGLGTALQARVVAKLRELGFSFLNTAGVKTDEAYLSVLRGLGANIEPDWVAYQKELA